MRTALGFVALISGAAAAAYGSASLAKPMPWWLVAYSVGGEYVTIAEFETEPACKQAEFAPSLDWQVGRRFWAVCHLHQCGARTISGVGQGVYYSKLPVVGCTKRKPSTVDFENVRDDPVVKNPECEQCDRTVQTLAPPCAVAFNGIEKQVMSKEYGQSLECLGAVLSVTNYLDAKKETCPTRGSKAKAMKAFQRAYFEFGAAIQKTATKTPKATLLSVLQPIFKRRFPCQ